MSNLQFCRLFSLIAFPRLPTKPPRRLHANSRPAPDDLLELLAATARWRIGRVAEPDAPNANMAWFQDDRYPSKDGFAKCMIGRTSVGKSWTGNRMSALGGRVGEAALMLDLLRWLWSPSDFLYGTSDPIDRGEFHSMTLERRQALEQEIVETQPSLRGFVRDLPTDLTSGSWDMVSYCFQQGFDAFWDLARASHNGLLDRPLLVLWRQSVELVIKAAILETAGKIENGPSHNLVALFDQLLAVRANEGCDDDDDLTDDVRAMIAEVQSFDPWADRFRYPAERNGKPYVGIAVDLDELFQSHWIITTWCEGATMELRGDYY